MAGSNTDGFRYVNREFTQEIFSIRFMRVESDEGVAYMSAARTLSLELAALIVIQNLYGVGELMINSLSLL